MNYARQLDPIFLIIHQFNEFVQPDEGFDANTDDDLEPANLWGNDLANVRQQIELYRQQIGKAATSCTGKCD
jgi:regulator of sirC expression with transglutaminase-like and TPR domain